MPISLVECLSRLNNSDVLITGGAGFIGSHLVDFLLRNNVGKIIIVDNFRRARQKWVSSRIQESRIHWVEEDIVEVDFDALLQKVDVIFHLAAISRVIEATKDPECTFLVNTLGTVRLTEAARKSGVTRLVFASSREVYGDPARLPVKEDTPLNPKNEYGASKAAAELYLQTKAESLPSVVILRLANVYGPGDSGRVIPTFLNNARNNQPLTIYGGEQKLDFVWIDTVTETLVKAGFSETVVTEPVNIGSGVVTTARSLAERVVNLTGDRIELVEQPSRSVEVESFQADLERASLHFGLSAPEEPLAHLSKLVSTKTRYA